MGLILACATIPNDWYSGDIPITYDCILPQPRRRVISTLVVVARRRIDLPRARALVNRNYTTPIVKLVHGPLGRPIDCLHFRVTFCDEEISVEYFGEFAVPRPVA